MSLGKLLRVIGLGLAVLAAVGSVWLALGLFERNRANEMGISDYESGWWFSAADRFAPNKQGNFIQPWLTPFNSGTAYAQDRNWQGAEADLRSALQLRPGEARCMISLNLAWTLEARGDEEAAAGNQTSARVSWQSAVQVLDDSGCQMRPEPQPGQETETRQRLAEKLGQTTSEPPPSQTPTPTPSQSTSQSQSPQSTQAPNSDAAADRSSQLEERNRSAASEARNEAESNSYVNPVESPW